MMSRNDFNLYRIYLYRNDRKPKVMYHFPTDFGTTVSLETNPFSSQFVKQLVFSLPEQFHRKMMKATAQIDEDSSSGQ